MHIAKKVEKGKYHIIMDLLNNTSKCGLVFRKNDLIESDKFKIRDLLNDRLICEKCYKSWLGK